MRISMDSSALLPTCLTLPSGVLFPIGERDSPHEVEKTMATPSEQPIAPVSSAPENRRLLELFSFGFDSWLVRKMPEDVFERLKTIKEQPLGRSQFNQLLHLCHEPGVSEGFFRYYWLTRPEHTYDVSRLPEFHTSWLNQDLIQSLEHLKWGLYRFYVDALLYIGDVRIAFKELRTLSYEELQKLFGLRRFDTEALKRRGPALPLINIAKDNRYLISEMACKSYGETPDGKGSFRTLLVEAFRSHSDAVGGKTTVRRLLEQGTPRKQEDRQAEFLFSADDILDAEVETLVQLEEKYESVFRKFEAARKAALKNTDYFLSMVSDLDVYVATSMRDRDDFRKMADFCDRVFGDPSLKALNLRYFDPTVSAAEGHEDKGLIECLMVKCAKILVYCAGKRDSFGKDAEAAMALSLGKPVIFFCDEEQRKRFFIDVHPLSRLIDFDTGVAVGAMVTSQDSQVVDLISRILENRMEYDLVQRPNGLRLLEKTTTSVVRLQTKNTLLRETFWNYYHNKI